MRFVGLLLVMAVQVFAQPASVPTMSLRLENVAYPYPVKFISHKTQGETLEMAYMDVKPANPNGKAVILFHGKNFSGNYWGDTADDLSRAGFRVIIPDQIGFGKSSKTDAIQYSFQLMAQQTKTLLDTLKIDKIIVIGHSMGGMLATRFALMYPDETQKLVLENPIGLEDWKVSVPYQSVDQWYASELGKTYEKLKAYQQNSYYHGQWKPGYDKWLDQLAGWLSNKDYPLIARNSALVYDMIFTQPVCYEFGNLKMPVLLIIGQEDRTALGKDRATEDVKAKLGNYPALGKITAAKIKNAKLVEIKGTGHSPHIENYSAFIGPLLAFLKQ